NVYLDKAPLVAPKPSKIFGTVDTPVDFIEAFGEDHILLMSKSAKCRLATFLTDLWVRLGKAEYLDVPMSYQDMADHLGLTIETVSRTISDLERSGMVTRVSTRRLLLQNRLALGHN